MNKLQIIKVRIKILSKNSSSYESYSASISCTVRVKSPAYSEPKRPCEPTKLYQQPCITCLLLTMVILIANGWACKFHCNLWSKQFLISDSFIYFTKEYLTGAFSLYELDRLAEISWSTAGLCQLAAPFARNTVGRPWPYGWTAIVWFRQIQTIRTYIYQLYMHQASCILHLASATTYGRFFPATTFFCANSCKIFVKFLLQDKKWQLLQNHILQQKKFCGWEEPAT